MSKQDKLRNQAEGLRRAADALDRIAEHPELAEQTYVWGVGVYVNPSSLSSDMDEDEAKKEWMKNVRRAVGGSFEKRVTSGEFSLRKRINVSDYSKETILEVSVPRDAVCKRVEVGTETVTQKRYLDNEGNEIEPTEVEVEQPKYDYVCDESILKG